MSARQQKFEERIVQLLLPFRCRQLSQHQQVLGHLSWPDKMTFGVEVALKVG